MNSESHETILVDQQCRVKQIIHQSVSDQSWLKTSRLVSTEIGKCEDFPCKEEETCIQITWFYYGCSCEYIYCA